MADNVVANAGSGGATFGSDDVGGVQYPRSKLVWGPDGTVNDADVASGKPLPIQVRSSGGVDMIGQKAMAASIPVVVASDQATLQVQSNSANIATEATAATIAGDTTSIDGKITACNTGAVTISAALPAGANKLGGVDLDSDATPGSAVPAAGQYVCGTDGTNARGLKTDSGGELQVDVLTVPANQTVNVAQYGGSAVGAGNAVHVQPGTAAVFPVSDNGGALTVDGTITANIGTSGSLALDATLTGGSQKAIARGAAKGATAASDATVSIVDADHNAVDVYVRGGGAGDGAILDGVTPATKATVKSYTNDNPLCVRLTDTNGDYVAAGAGTQYAEDTVAADGEYIMMAGVVRKDTAATLVSTDGDRTEMQVDASGRLHCSVGAILDSAGDSCIDATYNSVNVNMRAINDALIACGAGNSGTNVQRVVIANDQPSIAVAATLQAGAAKVGGVDLDSDAVPGSAAPGVAQYVAGTDGTNARGLKTDANGELQVDVLSIAAGANRVGKVTVRNAADSADIDPLAETTFTARINTMGAKSSAACTPVVLASDQASIPVAATLQAGTAVAGKVYITDGTEDVSVDTSNRLEVAVGNVAEVQGDVAHDAAISGFPLRIGARAGSADYTAVGDGDAADLLCTLNGKLVTSPYAIPEKAVHANTPAITGTSVQQILAGPGANLRYYITSILVTNSHATVGTLVEIRDGTSTVMWRGYAGEDGGGFAITFPTPLRQPTQNQDLNAYNITNGSNTYVSVAGFIAP